MAVVMIGVDPHKGSHTAVVISAAEEPLSEVRVRASANQVKRLLAWAVPWPERTWAIEGADGTGHLPDWQLLAAGERVLDIQPKLSARVRLLAAGATSKNDPNDARSVAVAALRSPSARAAAADDHATVLRIWSKRHRDLGRLRTQLACRLHAVLCELMPGGVIRELTAGQAAQLLGSITPADAVAAARRELAVQFTRDLRGIDAQMRDTRKKLTVAVQAAGTGLTGLSGVGPVIAATVIGDVRDVSRFPSRDHFAAWNGTAPIEVSSGARKGLPAVPARQPPARPRHPHGRGHPDPLPAQPGPRLLRQETGRRQDRQRSPARAEAADQRHRLRPPASRRPARRRQRERPGRATGERLWLQRGRLTPRTPALRTSHSRACPPAYDSGSRTARSCQAFPHSCHHARAGGRVKDRAQPGRAAAPAGRP